MKKEYDVLGIGNALVDILVQVQDSYIQRLGLSKGAFNPVDEKVADEIVKMVQPFNPKMAPAGSCPNTIMGIAHLGGKCSLVGKVGKDKYGDFYVNHIGKLKVHSELSRSAKIKTGRAICFITPDSQRTFAANLGAATDLGKSDIPFQQIKKSSILHLTA